jgi:outer membrane protein OmpA-like peptidoglycan-associated protein
MILSSTVRRFVISSVAAFSIALASSPYVLAATFNTAMSDVDWRVSRSVFECKLSHDVTGFGQAVFAHRAGEPEGFHLQQRQILLPAGEASVTFGHPTWQAAESLPRLLTRAEVVAETVPLRLKESYAQSLQEELLKGLRVIITRSFAGEERNPVRVVVEPLKFPAALKEYQECFKQLLPVSYADISRTTLYFDKAPDELSAEDKRRLNWMVLYIKADRSIKRVLVDGHTDSVGARPENLDASKLRAERIAAYLVAAGVDAASITTRWHGERYPVASNANDQGRQKNRRVTVRLER